MAGSFFVGGWAGLINVFLAFVVGLLIASIRAWFLLAGVGLGFVAPYLKKDESEYPYFRS